MENKYLEKVANRLKDHLASKGMNVEGISGQSLNAGLPASKNAGSFSKVTSTARKLGEAAGPKPSIGSRIANIAGLPKGSAGAQARKAAIAGSGQTLGQALKAHVEANAAKAAQTSTGGILARATGLVKKHPLAAAGGALAAGVMAGRAMKPSQPQQSYPQYLG